MEKASGSLTADDLISIVEGVLSDSAMPSARVAAIETRESGYRNVFPVSILKVEFEHGAALDLFVKHLGDEEADHPDKQVRNREVRVYRDLLTDKDLPVPRFYGARWSELTNRSLLFLEYFDAWKLKYHGPAHWFAAAERLADLHNHFVDSAKLEDSGFLIELDQEYFVSWAERAMESLNDGPPAASAEFAPVTDGYEEIARFIAVQPKTLVHNDLGPKNVLAQIEGDPPRVCFVDWEMAGVGCGLLDLSHLLYDRLEPADELRTINSYRRVISKDLMPEDEAEIGLLLRACELHTTIYRIAHTRYWGESAAHIAKRIEKARALHLSLRELT